MPFLIVHESGHPPRLFEFRSPSIAIGRAPECDLLLANVSVSRAHASIETRPDGSATVVSHASHNPVLINDVPIERSAVIEHGANIRLGKFKLTWLHEDKLDTYRTHQLSEMPRFNRVGVRDSNSTYAMSGALQKKLRQAEALREFGALTAQGGEVYSLGTESIMVGPNDTIPCESRWGRRTAAVVEWAGSCHEIKLTGLFAKLQVNGRETPAHMLQPNDVVTVNGTPLVYGSVRRKGL
jgi:hypothetical protein